MAEEFDRLAAYFDARVDSSPTSCFANGYSTGVEEDETFYDELVKELRALLPLGPEERILDVGCGTGAILSRLGPAAEGVDISPNMVEVARAAGLRATHYAGDRLPFPDATFDAVLIYQVLTNFPSEAIARHLIQEATRVLKPSGRLLVGALPDPEKSGFPTHSSWKTRVKAWLGRGGQIAYYSYASGFFSRLAGELGYSDVRFSPCGLRRPGWDTKYHALLTR